MTNYEVVCRCNLWMNLSRYPLTFWSAYSPLMLRKESAMDMTSLAQGQIESTQPQEYDL